jgi:excisionase family DNA binding protein
MSSLCRVLSRVGRRDVPRTQFTVLGMDHKSTVKPPLSRDPVSRPRFYSVAQAARMIGVSDMTLYRAIAAGEFPAVRIRGRLIIPAKAVEAMAEVATVEQTVVDAAGWAARR